MNSFADLTLCVFLKTCGVHLCQVDSGVWTPSLYPISMFAQVHEGDEWPEHGVQILCCETGAGCKGLAKAFSTKVREGLGRSFGQKWLQRKY